MATDLSEKRRNLAQEIILGSDEVIRGLERLVAAKNAKESAGFEWSDGEFTTPATKHVDTTILNNCLSSGQAIMDWVVTNFHDDNLQKARP